MNVARTFNNWRNTRQTVTELGRMSARELEDPGIGRADIRRVGRQSAARSAAFTCTSYESPRPPSHGRRVGKGRPCVGDVFPMGRSAILAWLACSKVCFACGGNWYPCFIEAMHLLPQSFTYSLPTPPPKGSLSEHRQFSSQPLFGLFGKPAAPPPAAGFLLPGRRITTGTERAVPPRSLPVHR
jgi:uncharacterized protein YjiS (DUF1127 family)